jgi:hypothetical protein
VFSATRKQRLRCYALLPLLLAGLSVDAAVPADELTVDPTLPLFFDGDGTGTNGSETTSVYTLSSILTRGDVRVAVINSQRVRTGDTVGGATVVAINVDSVTLDVAGRTQVLQLRSSTIRTPAGNGG